MKRSILFIVNGIGAVDGLPGVSGGDVRWIEIAKHWQRTGYRIHVLTPHAGVELCEKLGLKATFHISRVPNQYSLRKYMLRFLNSLFIPRTLRNFDGIVYSTTEHAYDVVPAMRIKGNVKESIWIAVVHWVAPLRRRGTSLLNSVLFFLNQRLGFHLIKSKADVVLAVSKNTAEQAKQIGIKKRIFPVCAGVDFKRIRKIAAQVKKKEIDAVFMKRFDGAKGVFDIIEIWRDVVKTRKDAKLLMIGLGTEETTVRLRKMVETYDIQDNVNFIGPIYDYNTKFSILASSSLLVLPSYEENWAIVIGEAMAAGVPVVCYDLSSIRSVWGSNVAWVPKGDKKGFANKIIEFLDSEQANSNLLEAEAQFMKRYDWQNIADEEMKIISSIGQRHD